MDFSHEKQPGKNFTGIAIVIILHVIVAYGIITGLGKRMVTKMAEAVETKIIEEVKPPYPFVFRHHHHQSLHCQPPDRAREGDDVLSSVQI